MEKPLDWICFTNRKRMIDAIQRLLDAGEQHIAVSFEAPRDQALSRPERLAHELIQFTDLEAKAIVAWLRGVETNPFD